MAIITITFEVILMITISIQTTSIHIQVDTIIILLHLCVRQMDSPASMMKAAVCLRSSRAP